MFNLANSVDPDQTTRSVASDLGLQCLPRSQTRTLYGIKGLVYVPNVVKCGP